MSNDTEVAMTVAQYYNRDIDITLGSILITMAVFGLCGNGFVLFVLAAKLKRRINYLTTVVLFQLALTDFIGVLPTSFIGFCLCYGRDLPRPTASILVIENVIGWLGNVMPLASIYIVTILSFGRCVAIYRSFDYPVVMSERNTHIMCAVAWTVAVGIALIPYYGGYHYVYDPHACFMFTSLKKTFPEFSRAAQNVVFMTVNLLVVLPALFMVSCCTAVVIRLKIKAHKGTTDLSADDTMAHAANTVLMITIAFILCYGPYFLSTFTNALSRFQVIEQAWLEEQYGSPTNQAYMVIIVHFMLVALNSCINPCIYYLRAKKFRDEMAISMRKNMLRLSTSLTRMSSFTRLPSRDNLLDQAPGFKMSVLGVGMGVGVGGSVPDNKRGNGKFYYRQLTAEKICEL